MRAFWDEFSKAIEQTKDLKISDVIDALDQDLGPHFFPARRGRLGPTACPACGTGRLGLKLGRFGSFIGCSNYPACRYTRRLAIETGEESGETLKEGMRSLGPHPDDRGGDHRPSRAVWALRPARRNGEDKKAEAASRVSLPRGHGRGEPDAGTSDRASIAATRDRPAPGDARRRSRPGSAGSGRM